MSSATTITASITASITAKAVLYSGGGGYDVVSVGERLVRAPAPGEIRIKVAAAAINPTDILLRDPGQGNYPLPMTPGMDAAGIVDAVGAGVTRLQVGDAVMAAVLPGRAEGGAQASYIVIPAASAVAKPNGITLVEAATVPMNGLTTLYALEHAALVPGQVLGISGGAGWLAYQTIVLAKLRGLTVVTDAKVEELERVRGYGADIVVTRTDDFAAAVRRAVPAGVDALLDTAVLGEAAFPAIREGGSYIPVRGWKGPDAPGIHIRPVMVPEVLERTEWLETLRQQVDARHIVPNVARAFTPEQVTDAQRFLLTGGVRGRPVLVF